MSHRVNTKSAAWDHVGGLFWTKGRTSARPSRRELDRFCAGIEPGMRCIIVGASTRDLVESVREVTDNVLVLDFSPRMCADLANELPGCDIRVVDITQPVSTDLAESGHWILAERLINRFDTQEAIQGAQGMFSLLTVGGRLRTSIKLGLYPMDEVMIEHGQSSGELGQFWDDATTTIDFSRAGDALSQGLLPHGSIERNVLQQWYVGRGREKRFNHSEVEELLLSNGFTQLVSEPLPDATDTTLYSATKSG